MEEIEQVQVKLEPEDLQLDEELIDIKIENESEDDHLLEASSKRKRNGLSVADKMKILNEIDTGAKRRDVSEKYEIASSTLSTIIKNRDSILCQAKTLSAERKRFRKAKLEEVDDAVLSWINSIKERSNYHLPGDVIRKKARSIASKLNYSNFHASNGWLHRFKNRYNISLKPPPKGEAHDSNTDNLKFRKEVIVQKLIRYEPKNIFTISEVGLFYKCLPDDIISLKRQKCFGGELSDDRIAVVFGCNMDGSEKLIPLVVGNNPSGSEELKSLDVDYKVNEKSWITLQMFEEWLFELNKNMKEQNREILIFASNCPIHCIERTKNLTNVKLELFPNNTNFSVQPMHQGIIKNFKIHYRKRFLKKVIEKYLKDQLIVADISLIDCISELSNAWFDDLTSNFIFSCFEQAGFYIAKKQAVSSICDDNSSSMKKLKEQWSLFFYAKGIFPELDPSLFIDVDSNVIVMQDPVFDELNQLTKKTDPSKSNETKIVPKIVRFIMMKPLPPEPPKPPKPSREEVFNAFQTLRLAFEDSEINQDIFNTLNRLESLYKNKAS